MQLKLYPTITLPILFFFLGLFLGQLQITVWIDSTPKNAASELTMPPLATLPTPNATPTPVAITSLNPTVIPTPPEKPIEKPIDNQVSPSIEASQPSDETVPGGFRVSNRTEHPVRIALLPWQSETDNYEKPAHWDFAPGEGSRKGLILSLPDKELKLKAGDILVVFAQDGSRLYWGPYVIGKTHEPLWSQPTQEWQLTLQP